MKLTTLHGVAPTLQSKEQCKFSFFLLFSASMTDQETRDGPIGIYHFFFFPLDSDTPISEIFVVSFTELDFTENIHLHVF